MTGLRTISNDTQTGIVSFYWNDGWEQRLTAAFLRKQCQCASCKADRFHLGQVQAGLPSLRVADIKVVGAYGVQIIFSDGHDRGIFPWVYLHALREDQR
jgi:DUF971 family protein